MSSGDRTRHPKLVFCPFCGEEERLSALWVKNAFRGHCDICGAYGPAGTTPLAAADFWNERAK